MNEKSTLGIELNRSKYWSLKSKNDNCEFPISFEMKNLILIEVKKGIYYFNCKGEKIPSFVRKEWDDIKRQGSENNIYLCDLIYKNKMSATEFSNNLTHTSFSVNGDVLEELPPGAKNIQCSVHFICKSLFESKGSYGALLYPQLKVFDIKFKTSPLVCTESLSEILADVTFEDF